MALLQLDDLVERRATSTAIVDVTPGAVARIKEILDSHPEKSGQGLRIYVSSGGCAGYSYGMAFDDPGGDDIILDVEGLKVLLDPGSLDWLKGARVDFVESLMGSGFSITNPNAKSSCGCGTSFSKDDGAPTDSCH